jgi:hypothetical protein
MTQWIKNSILLLCLNLTAVILCSSQEDSYKKITDSITAKVKRETGHAYNISGTDVDQQITDDREIASKDPFFKEQIKDPYHTLAGCFIFLASDRENQYPALAGFIGIYDIKKDSLLWHSVPLSVDFSSGALGSIDATGELNQDGKVEIIIGQATGNLAITHQLWIFNWDGKNGKLITQLDRYGKPEIMYWGDKFHIKDVDGDGIYEILGKWYEKHDSDTMSTIVYAWNGSLYGEYGMSSERLCKKTE